MSVVDPRTLTPLDEATILAEVAATGKALLVQEAPRTPGSPPRSPPGSPSPTPSTPSRRPIVRLCGLDAPIPYAPQLEKASVPQVPDIVAAARQLAKGA